MNEPVTLGVIVTAGVAVLGFTLRWIFSGTIKTIEKVAERVETMTSTVVSHGNSLENHGRRIAELEADAKAHREARAVDLQRLAQLEVSKPRRRSAK